MRYGGNVPPARHALKREQLGNDNSIRGFIEAGAYLQK